MKLPLQVADYHFFATFVNPYAIRGDSFIMILPRYGRFFF